MFHESGETTCLKYAYKTKLTFILFLVLLALVGFQVVSDLYQCCSKSKNTPKADYCIDGENACTEKVIEKINQTQRLITIQTSVTLPKSLTHALLNAKGRGVKIDIFFNKEASVHGGGSQELLSEKFTTSFNAVSASPNALIITLDKERTILGVHMPPLTEKKGSFGVFVFIENADLAKKYMKTLSKS